MWALVAVIALLLVERVWRSKVEVAERRRFINALMARTPGDFAVLEKVAAAKPAPPPEPAEPEEPVWGLAP